jgi:type IV secretion system protein TrbF
LGGLLYLSSQSRIEPYVVEINQGMPLAVHSLKEGDAQSVKVANYVMNQFIQNARSVVSDREAQKALLNRVYAYSANNTLTVLANYYKAHNPFDETVSQAVTVHIINSMPLSPHTWQVTWDEEARNKETGEKVGTQRFMATLTYAFGPVNPRFVEDNPFGLYVTDIAWAASRSAPYSE